MTTEAASQSGGPGTGQAAGAASPGATPPGAPGSTTTTTEAASQSGGAGTGQAAGGAAGASPPQGAQAAPEQPAAPETYALVLPDQSPLDQTDIALITGIAREKGWSTEAAQAALTEMHASLVEQSQRFRAELDADPEVGGAHLEQAQMYALRALDRFLPATEEDGKWFRHVMNKSGYGNNKQFLKFLSRVGRAMGEDRPGAWGGQARVGETAKRSQADRLFGDAQGIKPPT